MNALGRYFAAMWQARTWLAVVYFLISLPMAIVLFTYAVTGYAVGIGLAIIWVGVLVLIGVQSSMRVIGAAERRLAAALLQDDIPGPAPLRVPADATLIRRTLASFHDPQSWRVLAWILARIVLAPVAFAFAIVQLVLPLSLVAAMVIALLHLLGWSDAIGLQADDADAQRIVDTVVFWVAVGSPVLILLLPAPAWMVRALAELHRWIAGWALGICDRDVARAATARAELAEEQVRIDQELHDSIGHMITMNIVQAGAGAHVFDSDPEFARQALRTIEERGRAAMGELDRIIATIRGDETGERAPLPGIEDIPGLVEVSREAGIDVDAELDTRAVPPAIGRAAFGIVRESLTNAARHAPGAAVRVRVEREDDALGIEVVNGPPAPGSRSEEARRDGPRRGVAGMRDRVTLMGGRTEIGPAADGGFRVRVLLPLDSTIAPAGAGSTWDDLRVEVRA
ncbi:sensor histidine kinase [Demequina gelatinilytica]|uniref:sensor histidine kinase n=1 Tax=Demequina gelatinilytica TaxID=1638980 RepID=UPI0007801CC7|nr:sensor domain-containing protein [Demequina gelatinilytica]